MKKYFKNAGYFIKETGRTVKTQLLSNLFSALGTGLIFFLLGIVIAGWYTGEQLITMLSNEAEISVYFDNNLDTDQRSTLLQLIENLHGVREVNYINEESAKKRMKELLKEEAEILELFDDNPFEAFIQVGLHLDVMDTVLDQIINIDGVEYVRDNRDILEQIKGITDGVKILGFLLLLAVGITTVIIISHMIRVGIYNNREQINTLRLLGAPGGFIGFPYILVGLGLTLSGALFALILCFIIINGVYGGIGNYLPFFPVPAKGEVLSNVGLIIILASIVLGVFGSLIGLLSIRERNNA